MATALADRIAGWTLSHRVSDLLTGEYEDLRRLVRMMDGRPSEANYGLMALLRTIERDIETQTGMAALFARLGRQLNPQAKRKLVRNLIYNWAAVGARRRSELAAAGRWVPSFVVMSPTMRCNLDCTGCYAGLYSKRGELSEGEIRRILDEMRSFGAYFTVVSGGEPYLLKDMWLRIFR
ncbi:MAG TPA: radical SAM protein, partial [Vicinamibacteria bacterium]